MAFLAYAFVDGGHLRESARRVHKPLPDPQRLVNNYMKGPALQDWCMDPSAAQNVYLARLVYYDGRPDEDSDADPDLVEYWRAVELQKDTALGFGMLRGEKPPRQKGVDTLVAVDMLVGAFTKIYGVAVLVAGDGDYVPVVREVRRRGVMVALMADPASVSKDLVGAVDRYLKISPGGVGPDDFPAMKGEDGRTWPTAS